MPIVFPCSCGQTLRVGEEMAGKRVRCPGCQQVVSVPMTAVTGAAEGVYALQDQAPPNPSAGTSRDASKSRPSTRRTGTRRCHEIDYEIFGDDLQLVEIELDPGETVVAEAGAMTYLEQGIQFEARMGDGSEPNQGFLGKLWSAGKRAVTGESIFMTHFTNHDIAKRRVAFGAPYPGKILPLDMAQIGGELIVQKDGFLCAALGTKLDIAFQKKLGAGLFGGEGFILQRVQGDGLAFVHACGAIIERELHGETLRVDTGCIVAFTPSINYDIQKAGGLKSMFFGGEGFFLATLSGQGKVWLQSLPFSRLAGRILAGARGGKEQGSLLGGIANAIGGD